MQHASEGLAPPEGGSVNLYDEILRLPITHRLRLAGWILRMHPIPTREWKQALGIHNATIHKRASVSRG
jgi:hypothetical protein